VLKYLDNGFGVLYIGEGIVTGEDIINSNYEIFSSVEKVNLPASKRGEVH